MIRILSKYQTEIKLTSNSVVNETSSVSWKFVVFQRFWCYVSDKFPVDYSHPVSMFKITGALQFLRRFVPFRVSRNLKFNLLEIYVFLGCFPVCRFGWPGLEIRGIHQLFKKAPKWAFGNRKNNPSLRFKFFTDLLYYHQMNGFPQQSFQWFHQFRAIKMDLCSILSFTLSLWTLASLQNYD